MRYEDYRAAAAPDTRTIVFGGKARLSGLWVDDRYVADYVAAHPDTLIGFLSVDPTQPGWEHEMRDGHEELGLRGIKLLPMYAGFRPDDERLDPLWQYAAKHRLPVLLHTGTTFVSQAPLECTLPRHLDAVAIRFPEVKIILAHLGHPYEGECVVDDPQAPERLRRHQRPALPAVPALPQPDAGAGVRRVGQGAVRHRLPVHDRERDARRPAHD